MQRLRLKQGLSWIAIYAVALHVILTGFAPVAAAAAVDPFTVICHSGAATQDGPAGLVPGKACDHCNLCSSAAPPTPPVVALSLVVAPTRVLDILTPASAIALAGASSHPNFARGPPSFV